MSENIAYGNAYIFAYQVSYTDLWSQGKASQASREAVLEGWAHWGNG